MFFFKIFISYYWSIFILFKSLRLKTISNTSTRRPKYFIWALNILMAFYLHWNKQEKIYKELVWKWLQYVNFFFHIWARHTHCNSNWIYDFIFFSRNFRSQHNAIFLSFCSFFVTLLFFLFPIFFSFVTVNAYFYLYLISLRIWLYFFFIYFHFKKHGTKKKILSSIICRMYNQICRLCLYTICLIHT